MAFSIQLFEAHIAAENLDNCIGESVINWIDNPSVSQSAVKVSSPPARNSAAKA